MQAPWLSVAPVSVSPYDPCLVDSMGGVLLGSLTPLAPVILPPLIPRAPPNVWPWVSESDPLSCW